MLKNYVLIALRTLRRQRSYALLNVAGLAIGLGVCLTLALYVRHEWRYDRFLPNADRVVRVIRTSGDGGFNVGMPPGLAGELRAQAPAFEHVAAVNRPKRTLFVVGDAYYYVDDVLQTDAGFLGVFPHRLLAGDPATALEGPQRLVLTATTAARLFGDGDPVGRIVRVDSNGQFSDFTVTGVVADPPSHTHLRFNALRTGASGDHWAAAEDGIRWNYSAGAVYAALRPDTDPATAEAQLVAIEEATNDLEWMEDQVVRLEAAKDVHLYSEVAHDLGPRSDVRYLYLFGAIGLFILILACINYMNLGAARATLRAREVGVRKVVGAQWRQLVAQFLTEAVLMSLFALPLALGLAALGVPLVNRITGARITLDPMGDAGLLAALVGAALFAGLVAGSYPALYLARFRPVNVLKGRLPGLRRGHASVRRGLVVLQFAASLALIVGTLVVYAQLQYVQSKNLGFDEELVVTASTDGLDDGAYTALKAALAARPTVAAVSSGMPLGLGHRYMTIGNTMEDGALWQLGIATVDRDYFETLGMPIAEGQGFTEAVSAPAVVANRAAAQHLGADHERASVGEVVNLFSMSEDGVRETGPLVGIVEDFHNASLHVPRETPLMFRLEERRHGTLLVRLRPGNVAAALADVAAVWSDFVPDRPFDGRFLDDQIAAQYEKEMRLGQIFLIFAGLAVFVACLGLFGLTAFQTVQRTKEIGIRKVLGASVAGLVGLLSKEFLALVGVAFVVAAPLAYFAMQRWLEGFAYRVTLGPGVFLLALSLALAVAGLAVGAHAVRAALANPSDALRYE